MKRFQVVSVVLALLTVFACMVAMTISSSAAVSVTVSDGVMTVSGSGDMADATVAPDEAEKITSVVVESGVTSIGAYAFAECYNLTSVTIAPTVTSIGVHAFDGCESLTTLVIPASVRTIGDNAFFGCLALEQITFSEGLESIAPYAFSFCASLGSVTLPDSLLSVGSYSFAYCSSLTSAEIAGTTEVASNAFLSCASGFRMTVRGEEPALEGFVTLDGKLYYYENGTVKTGWFVVDGKTYYGVSTTGVCVNTDRKISGKQYFWNDETGLTLADGFYEVEGGTICYDNGVQVIGWRHTDGSGPVVDANGVSEQYSTSPNNLYYFLSTTGYMITDSTYKLGGYTREFNADHTVKPLNGYQLRYGIMYAYDNGTAVTGWKTDESTGNTYYFQQGSLEVYGRAATKWMYIGDKLYYFYASTSNPPYALKKSGSIGGIAYTYAEDGQILYTGFINTVYANANNSNAAAYIQKMNGTTRYLKNGEIQYGWQYIDGNWYYFYAKGSSNGSGYMCTESRKIGGVWYEFTSDGVCTSKS